MEGVVSLLTFLYKNEWIFFAVSEGLMWVFLLFFFITRYKLLMNQVSNLFLFQIIIINLFQAFLVCIDYYFTGSVSFFQVFMILFIIYASTIGRSDFKRLDVLMKKRYIHLHRTQCSSLISEITYRLILFAIHTTVFFLLHIIWYRIDVTPGLPNIQLFLFHEWVNYPHQGYYTNPLFNIMSYIWKIIYVIDLCILVIYTATSFFYRNKS